MNTYLRLKQAMRFSGQMQDLKMGVRYMKIKNLCKLNKFVQFTYVGGNFKILKTIICSYYCF